MGIYHLSWLGFLGLALVLTHITIITVTVYLHRSQAHRALDLNPVLCQFFRLWLWLTTGMNTREWVAVHRKHHAHVETEGDPHSPKVYGLWRVLFKGVGLYRKAAADRTILEKYGHGTPNDWLERNLYGWPNVGVILMLIIDLGLFGGQGFLLWVFQMLWIPLTAAGVINGVGHYIGYRNYEPSDWSRNIVPWGILIGGEELHNNHHAYPRSAKLSVRPFEFDLGYFYIRLLECFRLAKVRYVIPDISDCKQTGVKAILNARMSIYREFQKRVLEKAFNENLKKKVKGAMSLRRVKPLLIRHPKLLKELDRETLTFVLSLDEGIARAYQFQDRLYHIFYNNKGQDLMAAVSQWCQEAKRYKEEGLADFASWVEERFINMVQSDTTS